MCFFDQNRFECGDVAWSRLRQHCTRLREYQTAETCGMKLVMDINELQRKCKICEKIDSKRRRIEGERERLRRWARERYSASIEKAVETIEILNGEIHALERERQKRSQALAEGRINTPDVGARDSNGVERGIPHPNLESQVPMALAPSATQSVGFMNSIGEVADFARALSGINGSPGTYGDDPKSKLEPITKKEEAIQDIGGHRGVPTSAAAATTPEHKLNIFICSTISQDLTGSKEENCKALLIALRDRPQLELKSRISGISMAGNRFRVSKFNH